MMLERVTTAMLAVVCVALGCQPYRKCDAVDEAAVGKLPERLSQSGLYAPDAEETVAPDVRSFRPRFELWSDGASKRRFIWLPPGARIDTSDMDSWQFPVGTKLWKEFTRDGVRVETRLLQRLADGWTGVAYLWQEDGSDALAAPYGAIDALGTAHNVPAANECNACHGGRSSHVLGFSAVQLAGQSEADSLSLEELGRLELVSQVPAVAPRVPGNDTEQAALGYLHANCSHCHNASRPTRPGSRCFDPENDLDFLLRADEAPTVAETSTYRTATADVIEPGHPNDSSLLDLVSERSRFTQMPPLASELVDTDAVALLRRWIEGM
jgi:cytochrome c553